MRRHSFQHDGMTFSYLDAGGDGDLLIVLHAHWMGGDDFDAFAAAMRPDWRVVALDQRGHGHTDHTDRHSQDAYLGDVNALLAHLGVAAPVILLGHSFGGQVAYLYAARHPERVRALIIEEMDVERDDRDDFVLAWAGVHPSKEALEAKIGEDLTPYLQKSIKQVEGGWTLRWEPAEFLRSEQALNGNHWAAWLASDCPALIIRGSESEVVPGENLEAMAARRPNTVLKTLQAGHSVHVDQPEAFAAAVRDFLRSVGRGAGQ